MIELHTHIPLPTEGMLVDVAVWDCSCGEGRFTSQYSFMRHQIEGLRAELLKFQECGTEAITGDDCWLDSKRQAHHTGLVYHRTETQ